MKATCLINSHNYVEYVGEAIASALNQTLPFEEIIVVDDGSTDGSVDRIRNEFRAVPEVKLLVKEQAGQLSCFHRGRETARGDVVFFLDADDRYRPEMLQRAADIYLRRPDVDFLSMGLRPFGGQHQSKRDEEPTRDRGLSVLGVIYHHLWIGNPTSCLSMRAELLNKVLPFPFEPEWQTRADDVLIFGASLVGGHKFHLADPLVEYRIHATNNFARRKLNPADKMGYALRVNRLIEWYVERMGYDTSTLAHLLPREFRTLEEPTWPEFRRYARMSGRAGLQWSERLEQSVVMLVHLLKQRFGKLDAADAEVPSSTASSTETTASTVKTTSPSEQSRAA
ncbi:MAG: glycosyltransferase [Planctomycetota bacterium]